MDTKPINVLTVLVGLPKSGKSTFAKALGQPIVNLDSIRLALTGQPFYDDAESIVLSIAKIMIISLFLAGHDRVTLDATNVTINDRNRWIDKRWCRDFVYIDTSSEICISRAIEDDQLYLIPVITIKKSQFELPTDNELTDHEL